MTRHFGWLWQEACEGGSGKVPRKVQERSPTDPLDHLSLIFDLHLN